MLGLVLADNLLLLYVFWELTGLCSFFLISSDRSKGEAGLRAASHALLVTAAGGLSMLIGLLYLIAQDGHRQPHGNARSRSRANGADRCSGADATRGADQERPGADTLLAAWGHGGADPGVGLPPFGDDGQSGHHPAAVLLPSAR